MPRRSSAERRNTEYAQEGDLELAERLYDLAARLDRDDPVIPFNLGNVLDELGRERDAEIAYRQALARDRNFPDAWFNLGVLQEKVGRERSAVELRESLRRGAFLCQRAPQCSSDPYAQASVLGGSEFARSVCGDFAVNLRRSRPPAMCRSISHTGCLVKSLLISRTILAFTSGGSALRKSASVRGGAAMIKAALQEAGSHAVQA